ncbi:MAG: hypothetical protein NZ534_01650, partial [Bacteroidia bacterium]|nr:hypothetical protein [Bacteroidia bacterium]
RYVNFPLRCALGATVARNLLVGVQLRSDLYFRAYPVGSAIPNDERFYIEFRPWMRYYFAASDRVYAPYFELGACVNYGRFLEHRLETEVDPTFRPFAYARSGGSWNAGGALGLALFLDSASALDLRLGYDYLPSAAAPDPNLHRLSFNVALTGFLGGFAGVAGREFCAVKTRAGNFFYLGEIQAQWLSSKRLHFFWPLRFGFILADRFSFGPTTEVAAFSAPGQKAWNAFVGPFMRYFVVGDGIMPFLEIMGAVGRFAQNAATTTVAYNTFRFGAGVGFDVFVGPNLAFEVEFFYRPYRYFGGGQNFVFDHTYGARLGLAAFVHRRKK